MTMRVETGLAPDQFARAFPFHIVIDDAGRITQLGDALRRVASGLGAGDPFAQHFEIVRPRTSNDFADLRRHQSAMFVLRLRDRALTLRGQLMIADSPPRALFLTSPWITTLGEATGLGLSLADFPNHDTVGEFLLLFQAKDTALTEAEQLTNRLRDQRAELRDANRRLADEVTERRRVEETLRHRETQLVQANGELLHAARLKDEFLSGMSHELRTPLNAILGAAEALDEGVYGPLAARQAATVQQIDRSGRHLLELINDILDLSKIQAGMLTLEIGPTDVAGVCDDALAMVALEASRKRLRLSCSIGLDTPTLPADARRLKQMLVNLLSNAVKFTPEHGTVALDVFAPAGSDAVTFAVEDSGIGIAADRLGELFTPFVQLDSRLGRRYEGTGLGLALVKRMAELHCGSVHVASTPGVGSRFSITLPRAA